MTPALKRLTIQLDAAELETRQVKAYVVQKDGTMRNISLESDGDLLTGRIDGIADECELHIETELCANADCMDKHPDECGGADR